MARQSVLSKLGATEWTALMAAWIWYGPGLAALDARAHDGLAFGDQVPVPEPPVLFGQAGQRTVGGDAGGAAGVQQQEQRQQPLRLRLVRHQPGEHPGEPDRLRAQVEPDQRSPAVAA